MTLLAGTTLLCWGSNMAFVIAITGGIASGKTTVADLFHSQFGIEIVDADIIARQVVEPGTTGLKTNRCAFRY